MLRRFRVNRPRRSANYVLEDPTGLRNDYYQTFQKRGTDRFWKKQHRRARWPICSLN
jgi:hypothetical protein